MKINVALYSISNEIKSFIDTEKFNIMEFNNFEKMKISLKNIKIIVVDLEQKMNFKDFFKNIKLINENILILGLINFNRLRIATKLLKDELTDYMIQDNKGQLKDINSRLEHMIDNSQKRIENMRHISMFEFINLNADLKRTMNNIVKISNANIPILIQGEQGCEHELYAEKIHNISDRKDKPFLNIFCPSLNQENMERVLYGDKEMIGKLEQASNGTIFFENIDLLNPSMQNILARIIERREVDGIGGTKKTFNLRMIASTNKNLEEEARKGRFNEDLYFMINGYTLNIPPLRETRNIIPLLVKNLYKYYSIEQNKEIKGITNKALKILETYDWPGNVKEIKNTIRKAIILTKGMLLDETDFLSLKGKNIIEDNRNNFDIKDDAYSVSLFNVDGSLKTMKMLEQEIVDKYMKINDGNITETAKALNIGRTTLYRKLESCNE